MRQVSAILTTSTWVKSPSFETVSFVLKTQFCCVQLSYNKEQYFVCTCGCLGSWCVFFKLSIKLLYDHERPKASFTTRTPIMIHPQIVDPELWQALKKRPEIKKWKNISIPDLPSKPNKKSARDEQNNVQNALFLDSISSPNQFSAIRVEENDEDEDWEVKVQTPPLVLKL